MPVTMVDPVRRRAALTPPALATAVLLLAGPLGSRLGSAVADEVAALERAGLVRRGRLVGWLAELVALVVAAELRLSVQQAHGAASATTEMWADEGRAAIGELADPATGGTVTLSGGDAGALPVSLAQLVGLGARPDPVAEVAVHPRRLRDIDRLRAPVDRLAAIAALAGAGRRPTTAELAALTALVVNERRSWRVTAEWTDDAGRPVVGSLAVLDAGPGGLWLADHVEVGEPGGAPAGRTDPPPLVPVSSASVARRLVALLPPTLARFPVTDPQHDGSPSCPTPPPPTPSASSVSSRTPSPSTPA